MARKLLLTAVTAAGLSLGACGDDKEVITGNDTPGITTVMPSTHGDGKTTGGDDSTGTTDESSGSGAASDTSDTTSAGADTSTTGADTSTTGDLDTTGGDESTGTTAVDPIEQCLSMVELGDECGECSCMSCLEELQACQADEGCREIRICAAEAGCSGIDCLGPCSSVINLYGGPFGVSGMLAQAIGTCVGTECPGLCSA